MITLLTADQWFRALRNDDLAPEIPALSTLIGAPQSEAVGYVAALRGNYLDRPIASTDVLTIEPSLSWPGAAGVLVKALIDVGILIPDGGGGFTIRGQSIRVGKVAKDKGLGTLWNKCSAYPLMQCDTLSIAQEMNSSVQAACGFGFRALALANNKRVLTYDALKLLALRTGLSSPEDAARILTSTGVGSPARRGDGIALVQPQADAEKKAKEAERSRARRARATPEQEAKQRAQSRARNARRRAALRPDTRPVTTGYDRKSAVVTFREFPNTPGSEMHSTGNCYDRAPILEQNAQAASMGAENCTLLRPDKRSDKRRSKYKNNNNELAAKIETRGTDAPRHEVETWTRDVSNPMLFEQSQHEHRVDMPSPLACDDAPPWSDDDMPPPIDDPWEGRRSGCVVSGMDDVAAVVDFVNAPHEAVEFGDEPKPHESCVPSDSVESTCPEGASVTPPQDALPAESVEPQKLPVAPRESDRLVRDELAELLSTLDASSLPEGFENLDAVAPAHRGYWCNALKAALRARDNPPPEYVPPTCTAPGAKSSAAPRPALERTGPAIYMRPKDAPNIAPPPALARILPRDLRTVPPIEPGEKIGHTDAITRYGRAAGWHVYGTQAAQVAQARRDKVTYFELECARCYIAAKLERHLIAERASNLGFALSVIRGWRKMVTEGKPLLENEPPAGFIEELRLEAQAHGWDAPSRVFTRTLYRSQPDISMLSVRAAIRASQDWPDVARRLGVAMLAPQRATRPATDAVSPPCPPQRYGPTGDLSSLASIAQSYMAAGA